ncbi:MAG: LptF/LptG family permease [Armatimonadetes bacterium]|nr:LptF/LptG family permease [Armatimonadota bacterium]
MLRRLDALIFRELFGPWVFGVVMYTLLIVAATFLGRISDYLSQGLNPMTVLLFLGLNLPGVMVKTFAMAMLLAGLLAFGRLSSDSEIIAVRAAGVSLFRIMVPVAIFALAVAVAAFAINEIWVPRASMETLRLQSKIERNLKGNLQRVVGYPLEERGKLRGILTARDLNLETRTLREATIQLFNADGRVEQYLTAVAMQIEPQLIAKGQGWRIVGGATITSRDGSKYIQVDGDVWPSDFPRPNVSAEALLTDKVSNLDVFSMSEIKREIEKEKAAENPRRDKIANYEFGYWNKIGLPLAAVIFGLLGAPLGIQNRRTGTASGFAISVGISFLYIMLANTLNTFAMNGAIPAFVASFTPLVIGLIVSCIIIWRRNS